MLSGLAFMPLQLLELGTVIPRVFSQVFLTKTPRGASLFPSVLPATARADLRAPLSDADHAELNAPAMVNLGVVYPQVRLSLGLVSPFFKAY